MAERLRQDQVDGLAAADLDPDQTARFITVTTRGSLLDLTNAPEKFDAEFAASLARAYWLTMYGPDSPAVDDAQTESSST